MRQFLDLPGHVDEEIRRSTHAIGLALVNRRSEHVGSLLPRLKDSTGG